MKYFQNIKYLSPFADPLVSLDEWVDKAQKKMYRYINQRLLTHNRNSFLYPLLPNMKKTQTISLLLIGVLGTSMMFTQTHAFQDEDYEDDSYNYEEDFNMYDEENDDIDTWDDMEDDENEWDDYSDEELEEIYGEEFNPEDSDWEDYEGEYEDDDDYNDFEDQIFEDQIFGELTDEERDRLDEEFERHEKVIDPMYDNYYETENEAERELIKQSMSEEITNHYNNLLTQTNSEEGRELLAEEKNMYLESLDYLDEEREDEWDEDEYEDDREDDIFGEDADRETIDAIFEKHETAMDDLFDTLDEQVENEEETSQTKAQLREKIDAMYQELLPYTSETGKSLLDEEKEWFVDYINNYEDEEYGDDFEDDDYDYDEEWNYPEIKELSDEEWNTLESLRTTHDDTMDSFFEQLESKETSRGLLQQKMIEEIKTIYSVFLPYITTETQVYLEEEKNDYLSYIEDLINEELVSD